MEKITKKREKLKYSQKIEENQKTLKTIKIEDWEVN